MRKQIGLMCLCILSVTPCWAGSKLLATGGASPIEGGGGGGISPWALISGYGSSSEWGGSAFITRVDVDDFSLTSRGVAAGWNDRVEVSYVRQTFDIDPLDLELEQDVFGVKARVFGTFLYSRWPQIAVGLQHKRQKDFAVPAALGAEDDSGTDVYVSASKLFFAPLAGRNLLVNATVRHTSANETGLVGFAGPGGERSVVFEGSVAAFINDNWVVGYEYRQKPDHLDSIRESDWQHVFAGYFPNKHFAIIGAWVDLDSIANLPDQTGPYLSLQVNL